MKKLLSCLLIETYKISDFVTDVEYNTSRNPQKASHSHSWKLYKTYQPRKKTSYELEDACYSSKRGQTPENIAFNAQAATM